MLPSVSTHTSSAPQQPSVSALRASHHTQAERAAKRAQKKAAKAEVQVASPSSNAQSNAPGPTQAFHAVLPVTLNAKQRALVHEAAEQAGLQHESRGDENARGLHIGDLTLPEVLHATLQAAVGRL